MTKNGILRDGGTVIEKGEKKTCGITLENVEKCLKR